MGYLQRSPLYQKYFKYQSWYLTPCCGLAVQAHSRVSTINFDIWNIFGEGVISHEKYIKNGKVLVYLGFKSKILPRPLTDLSACVLFCTSSPQQSIVIPLHNCFFQIWKLIHDTLLWAWGAETHQALKSVKKYLCDLSARVGFCTSSSQQGVKYQLWYLKYFYGRGSL
jgi:hypothetical protein